MVATGALSGSASTVWAKIHSIPTILSSATFSPWLVELVER